MHGISAHCRFDDLDARSLWVSKCKNSVSISTTKQATSIKKTFIKYNGKQFLCDLDFTNRVYMASEREKEKERNGETERKTERERETEREKGGGEK